jgi:DNA/RNA endonuclease G (NUC1)
LPPILGEPNDSKSPNFGGFRGLRGLQLSPFILRFSNAANKTHKEYLTIVRELEQLTGYNFLSDVPQAIQDVIEVCKDGE